MNPIEIPLTDAFDVASKNPFKGNINIDELRRILTSGVEIGFVVIELGNNASGGGAVALSHLKEIKALLLSHNCSLVVDATRIIDNALLIQKYEHQHKSVRELMKEIISCADHLIASLTKNFGLNVGAILATNDDQLFSGLQESIQTQGSGINVENEKLIKAGLMNMDFIEQLVSKRQEQVRDLCVELKKLNIPVSTHAEAHAVLFEIMKMEKFQHLEYPLFTFISWMYMHTGVRGGIHSGGMSSNGSLNQMVRLALPIGLSASEITTVKQRIRKLFEEQPPVFSLILESKPHGLMGAVKRKFKIINTHKITSGMTELREDQLKKDQAQKNVKDIAIIGMSGRFPMAADIDTFWKNLSEGRDCITIIPEERWDYRKQKNKAGTFDTKYGGFIEDVDKFDSLFFTISPKEAENMDPQERLFLEIAHEAVENAGYSVETLTKESSDFGVYVGAVWSQYQVMGAEATLKGQPSVANSFHWSIANRTSYFFNFSGPSMAIDTACSSSLTALHLACESILSGNCKGAIVGGVNLDIHPSKPLITNSAKVLSPQGKCKSFGKDANGYVAGEGIAAILLKSLEQAEKDGDHIYGIIKSTAINHGGKANNYTVPNLNSQADLIKKAIEKAAIPSESINYIEAHGTGTALGDPIEVAGITKALGLNEQIKNHCSIGSVKSNIGHLEAAAGIAGVIKVLVQLQHKTLVPSLHCDEVNPFIDFSTTPLFVQKSLQEWKPVNSKEGVYPRRAGISSFGAGGTNAHVIVEEYRGKHKGTIPSWNTLLLILSAKNDEVLAKYIDKLISFLEINKGDRSNELFHRIAYTLQTGRKAHEIRLIVAGNNLAEWIENLKLYKNGQRNVEGKLYWGIVKKSKPVDTLADERGFEKAVSNYDYLLLAKNWTSGAEINWAQLYTNFFIQKIAVPVYPFEKVRHWIEPVILDAGLENSNVLPAKLHPLVDDIVQEGETWLFKKNIHPDDFYMKDHIVAELKTLPGVTYMEIGKFVTEFKAKNKVTVIKNMVWAQPIQLTDSSIDVTVAVTEKRNILNFEIFSNQKNTKIIHAQGKVLTEEPQSQTSIHIQDIRKRCTAHKSEQEIYKALTAHGIRHLHSFRVLKSISFNDREGISEIKLPDSLSDTFHHFMLHPSIMDGALQTVAAMSQDAAAGRGVPDIPFVVKELHILKPLEKNCFAYAERLPSPKADIKKFNISLLNEQGEVLIWFKEFSVATLDVKQEVIKQAEIAYYTPVWVEQKVNKIHQKEETIFLWTENEKECHQVEKLIGSEVLKLIDTEIIKEEEHASTQLGKVLSDEWEKQDIENKAFKIMRWIGAPQIRPEELLLRESKYLLTLVKSLKKINAKADIIYIYPDQGAHYLGALTGFSRSLVQESRHLKLIMTSLDAPTLKGLDSTMLKQLLETDEHIEICYKNKQRYVTRLKVTEVNEGPPGHMVIKDNGVYLITGGQGELGYIFAKHLAQKKNVKLILTCRSEMKAETRQLLRHVSLNNCEVSYLQADISREEDVKGIAAFIKNKYAALHGIIHAAGLIRDSMVTNKSNADLQQVLLPKIKGTILLDQLSKDFELDFFVLFSSVSALLGNVGQTDYSTGNQFMNMYTTERQKLVDQGTRSGISLSINWPLWKEGGMKVDDAVINFIKKRTGLDILDSINGCLAFEKLLLLEKPVVLVIPGDQTLFKEKFNILSEKESEILLDSSVSSKPTHHVPSNSTIVNININDTITREVLLLVSNLLKVAEKDLDPDKDMSDYGADSTSLTEFSNILNDKYGSDITPAVFFEFSSIKGLAEHLVEEYKTEIEQYVKANYSGPVEEKKELNPVAWIQQEKTEINFNTNVTVAPVSSNKFSHAANDIAIIGISGKFPESENIESFWENITANYEMITDIPVNRFNWKEYEGDVKEINKMISRKGGFIPDVDKFDPLFFGIAPSEAEFMDPQQRIYLETVWHAIENAGYKPSDLSNTKTGVFVGLATSDYYEMLHKTYPEVQAHFATGNAHSVLPNRISYLLNLRGPSEPVDTACSSSLVAIHRGMKAIYDGECDMAIAGGVGVMLTATTFIAFSKAGMLAKDGKCKTFSQQADGYVRGEGSAAILIKRLDKAIQDNDHIHAVIKGSSINHGGKAASLTAPNPNAQAELLVDAYTRAQVDPSTVSYIEAHGTGTPLGDPVEVNALKKAFTSILGKDKLPEKPYIGLGSVKSHIGHLEAAAGIAGIAKMVMALQHKTLPATRHCEEVNAYIKLDNSPFYIHKNTSPWNALKDQHGNARLRRCGVSSFGFGGVNAHVILEEYPQEQKNGGVEKYSPQVFILSAKEEDLLKKQIVNFKLFIKKVVLKQIAMAEPSSGTFANIAYTLQEGREMYDQRIAFFAENFEDLENKLENYFLPGAVLGYCQGEASKSFENEVKLPAGINTVAEAQLIMQAWVKGAIVKWSDYRTHQKVKRVPLPGYPFARESYWIPYSLLSKAYIKEKAESELKRNTNGEIAENKIDSDHRYPFIKRNNLKPHEISYEVVHEKDDVFLSSHIIKGQSVLPGANYLEIAKAVLSQTHPLAKNMNVKDITWDAPFLHVANIKLYINLFETDQTIRFEIVSETDQLKTLHSTGSFLKENNNTGFVKQKTDINQLISQCRPERSKLEIYQTFSEVGFEYGPALQVLQKQYTGEKLSVSYYTLPLPFKGSISQYKLHPVIVDGAFQAIDGIVENEGWKKTRLSVAYGIDEFLIHEALQEEGYVVVRLVSEKNVEGFIVKSFDLLLTDLSGNTCATIKGFRIKSIVPVYKNTNAAIIPSVEPISLEHPGGGIFKERVLSYFKKALAETLRLPEEKIKPQTNFENFGIDSFMINTLTAKLEKIFGAIPKTLFFEVLNLDEMTDYFIAHFNDKLLSLVDNGPEKKIELPATDLSRAIEYMRNKFAEVVRLPLERVKANDDFERYGIDSLLINSLTQALENDFGKLPKTLFFELSNLNKLTNHLWENYQEVFKQRLGISAESVVAAKKIEEPLKYEPVTKNDEPANSSASEDDIAVIGISGTYPRSRNLNEFWLNLQQGKDCISEVPLERWDYKDYFNEDREKMGSMSSRWGGFIDDVEMFDPLFFNISPKEAEALDPNERLFLQTVWETIEDAGYNADHLRTSKTGIPVGVFVGVMWGQYAYFGLEEEKKKNYIVANSTYWSIANRVSYFFDFQGPSMAIDTACSSSLTSIHVACESLKRKECGIAIAGGINLTIHPRKYVELSQGKFLSSDGRCRSFGEGGDGYVPGEGVGACLLKPLQQAIKDGDTVYGVIKGTSVNHGGKTNGFSVPSPKAQSRLIASAIDRAGIHPEQISYIEAHGTGTSLGDPIEVAGLVNAFGGKTKRTQFCAVGSVKSNIGHLEAAAGIAALSKVLLQMKHQQLVPTLHSKDINKNLSFLGTPFFLQQELKKWECSSDAGDPTLYAGLSSFGAGGSNAHIVLRSYEEKEHVVTSMTTRVICLSAKTNESLVKMARNLLVFIRDKNVYGRQEKRIQFDNIAYTLSEGRKHFTHRLAVVCKSIQELDQYLMDYLKNKGNNNWLTGKSSTDTEGTVFEEGSAMACAQKWVAGYEINWNWTPNLFKRISLPTYEFNRRKCWVNRISATQETTIPPVTKVSQEQHRFIDENTSVVGKFSFEKKLLPTDEIVSDHQFQGVKIKPGMLDICMVMGAAKKIFPNMPPPSVENIIWKTPLNFNQVPEDITISLVPEEKNAFRFSTHVEQKELASGKLVYTGDPLVLKNYLSRNIKQLQMQFDHSLSKEQVYDHFQKLGMVYKNRFTGINKLWPGKNNALSIVDFNEPISSVYISPFLLDSICQTLLGINYQEGQHSYMGIPLSLDKFILLNAELGAGKCWVYAETANGEIPQAAPGKRQKYTISVYTEQGMPVLIFEGLMIQFSAGNLIKTPEADEKIMNLYTTEWKQREGEKSKKKQHLVLIHMGEQIDEKMEKEFTEAGHLVHSYCIANDTSRKGDADVDLYSTSFCTDWIKSLKQQMSNPVDMFVLVDDKQVKSLEESNYKQSTQLFFNLSKAILKAGIHSAHVLYVFHESVDSPMKSMLSGFCRTLNNEGNCNFRTVAIDSADNKERCNLLKQEINLSTKGVTVKYQDGKRFEKIITDAFLGKTTHDWKNGDAYLITGGAGGLGKLFSHYLAEKHECVLVLTGRKGIDKEIEKQLLELSEKGSKAFYFQTDITDKKQVALLHENIKSNIGKLNGIIHAAGIINDGLIVKKDFEVFQSVLAPKVQGTLYLDELFASEKLDFFILFSSLASLMDNMGQADYSTANYFLDEFSTLRNTWVKQGKRKGKTISVNWPLWKDGGMQLPEMIKKGIALKTGLHELQTQDGINVFERILKATYEQIIVVPGDTKKLEQFLKIKHTEEIQVNGKTLIDDLINKVESEAIDIDQLLLEIEKFN